MKLLVYTLATLFIASLPIAASASSVNETLKLDVYPLNCVFEYVNNGTQQITFLTPKECGQEITVIDAGEQTASPITITNPVSNGVSAAEQNSIGATDSSDNGHTKSIEAQVSLQALYDAAAHMPQIMTTGLATLGTVALLAIVDLKFFGYSVKIAKFLIRFVNLFIK
jgi:hypothetical protein